VPLLASRAGDRKRYMLETKIVKKGAGLRILLFRRAGL
jgi:hypothetical protein